MARNGVKSGGGSRKGIYNKSTREIRDILDNNVDWNVVAQKLYSLAKGVMVQETDKSGVTEIYERPPSEAAAKTLIEFRFGKAKAYVEHSGSIGNVDVTNMPLDELVALRNAATRVLSTAN